MKQNKRSHKRRGLKVTTLRKGGKNHKNWNFLANNPKLVGENGQDSPTTKFNHKTKEKRAEKSKKKIKRNEKPIFATKSGSKNTKETWGERPEKCTAALEGEESRKTILDKSKCNQSH